MIEELRKYLSNLDHYEAAKIWEWLDSNPDAVEEMIEVIASSHPLLQEELCGKPTMEKIPFNPEAPFKGDD